MNRRHFFCLAAGMAFSLSHVALARLSGAAPFLSSDTPFKVLNVFPHDPQAFTQGLIYHDGFLYESTGGWGASSLRQVELETGRVLRKIELPRQYFAEGLTLWGDRLIQLTWTSEVGFVYDLSTLKRVGSFSYAGEGWGLTHDGQHLIMSNGSNTLLRLDPATYGVIDRIHVFDRMDPVPMLNELEYVQGQIWANVFGQDRIARIDPVTGYVLAWIDLAGKLQARHGLSRAAVLNGIAFDPDAGRIFVTGKLWPKMYELAPL